MIWLKLGSAATTLRDVYQVSINAIQMLSWWHTLFEFLMRSSLYGAVVHACGRCYTNHREWFKISREMAMRIVLYWAKCIGSQPYDNKGALDAAWMRILDGRHLSRLRLATED